MKYYKRILCELIRMLRVAISELRLHNGEYHHRTPESLLQGWEQFIEKVENYERYS